MRAKSQPVSVSGDAHPVGDKEVEHLKTAISLKNVDVTFDGESGPVKAVSNVTLQLRKREFVSIVGRSGCGKSTLLRVIAGLLRPSAGEVAAMGTTAEEARLYRSFGIVFQSNVMLPWLTALENARLPLNIIGTSSIPPRFSPSALLEMVGLKGNEGLYPRQLSGGMRQRVALARALSFDPPILLMDEPFAAVDALTRQKLHSLLLDICARTQTTVLFITHDVYEAVLLSDRVLVMSEKPGTIEADVHIPFARPRGPELRSDPVYGALCAHILDLLMSEK